MRVNSRQQMLQALLLIQRMTGFDKSTELIITVTALLEKTFIKKSKLNKYASV